MTGYRHPRYARSLTEFGVPRHLPRSGGWLLQRRIPGAAAEDAMGCYPLFTCRDWAGLPCDLEELRGELVSVVLVTDPFGDYTLAGLKEGFDLVAPFKDHFIVDYREAGAGNASKHHRYYTRRALGELEVEQCRDPLDFLDEWQALYTNLVERHRLTGIRAFSRAAFAEQLSVPGMVVFRAAHERRTVGAHLYYEQDEVAYSHLAAFSPAGYARGAAYALQRSAINHFAERVSRLDLGAGAGLNDDGEDGLSRFKRGWANATSTAYLCGRILDPETYAEVVRARGVAPSPYFPLYRKGEFA